MSVLWGWSSAPVSRVEEVRAVNEAGAAAVCGVQVYLKVVKLLGVRHVRKNGFVSVDSNSSSLWVTSIFSGVSSSLLLLSVTSISPPLLRPRSRGDDVHGHVHPARFTSSTSAGWYPFGGVSSNVTPQNISVHSLFESYSRCVSSCWWELSVLASVLTPVSSQKYESVKLIILFMNTFNSSCSDVAS